MYCGECGKPIDDDARFCPYCGNPVETEETKNVDNFKNDEAVKNVDNTKKYDEREYVEYVEEKLPSERSGVNKTVVIAILVIAIVAIAAFFTWKLFFSKTENDNVIRNNTTTEAASTNQPATNDTVTDDDEQVAEHEGKGLQDGLPKVYEDASVDYSKVLSPDDYETFEAEEGYSFAYPKNFYNEVYTIDGGYSFNGDDGVSEFEIYKADNTYSTVSDAIESYYDSAKNQMNVYDEIIHSPDKGTLILGAKNNFDDDVYYYYLVKATGANVYVMKVTYPYDPSESKESRNQKDYMVDCMYRYCSFSGGTYQPRTYQQFKNDDMGTKK